MIIRALAAFGAIVIGWMAWTVARRFAEEERNAYR